MSEGIWARGIDRVKWSWDKYRFNLTATGVLSTAPLQINGNSPLFLSQICHQDVTAYLLAIKSLYLAIGQGRVMVVNDGSLTTSDISTLHKHIPELKVLDIASIGTGSCPRGGTWERLVKIVELTAEHYVIQADADTLVSGPIPEVIQCWRENKSFLLGTGSGQSVLPAAITAGLARKRLAGATRKSVGTLAEAALDVLPETRARWYVHASSGFAGFAKGAFSVSDVVNFSVCMREHLGDCWDEWGSEQITSNYILANAPNTVVLPLNRYACFGPPWSGSSRSSHLPVSDLRFLHFFGTYRHNGGLYRTRVRAFLAQQNRRSLP